VELSEGTAGATTYLKGAKSLKTPPTHFCY
jgi:hypothetical protein